MAKKKNVKKNPIKDIKLKKVNKKNTKIITKNKNVKKIINKKSTKKIKNKIKNSSKKNKINFYNIFNFKIVLIILAIIIFSSLGIQIIFNNNSSQIISKEKIDPNALLIIIDDPKCKSCLVDVIVSQMKKNIFKNITYQKIDYKSKIGQKFVKELNLKFIPTYLFKEKIINDSKWGSLQGAFIKVKVGKNIYYKVNPNYIPNKEAVNEIPILNGAIVLGNPNAKVTVYEFSDYECPFCAVAEGNLKLVTEFRKDYSVYEPPVPKLFKEYINTGKVKYVFYNYPIEQIHIKSRSAHNAGLCANEQNNFKDYSKKLFYNRDEWMKSPNPIQVYINYAKQLNLDITQFSKCLTTKKYNNQINNEIALAKQMGISGTPAFIINRVFVSGAMDYLEMKRIIDKELGE